MRINVITGPTPVSRTIVRVDIESDRVSVSLNLAETIELYQRLSLFLAKPPTAADLEFVKERPETLGDRRKKIEKALNEFRADLADAISQIEQPAIKALLKFFFEMADRP